MSHDPVNHPSHYTSHPSGVECIQITRHLPFDVGNAVKYVWRADMKNGLEDLRKAEFYLTDHLGEFGDKFYPLEIASDILRKVTAAEAALHGPTHPRVNFYLSVGYGFAGYARIEVRRLIDLCEEGSR